MTLPELTYDLVELVRQAHIVDDENISHQLVAHWIHNQRALWCKRDLDRFREIDDNILQDILTDVELVDKSLDPELPSYEHTGMIYRTKLEIPELVETLNGRALLEVRLPDIMGYHVNEVPWHQFNIAGQGRWTNKQIFVSLRDHKFYFKFGKDNMSPIMKSCIIRGVFQDPTKVPNYNFKTSNYPLNRSMYTTLKDKILQLDMAMITQSPTDTVNDSSGILKR